MTEHNLQVVKQIPEPMELNVEDVKRQVNKIQKLMTDVLQKDVHYGKIPGTDKDTLYKGGAEKICFMFRLSPTYSIDKTWDGDHLSVAVTCDLRHLATGALVGSGVGYCSSKESKYRYRLGAPEPTDKRVPRDYWDLKKANKMAQAQIALGGKGFVPFKTPEGAWVIAKKSESKVDNPDIADVYNTVIKMACKRAYVAATITGTAASDVFTQDLEEGFEEEARPQEQQPVSGTEAQSPASEGGTGPIPPTRPGSEGGKHPDFPPKRPVNLKAQDKVVQEIVKDLSERAEKGLNDLQSWHNMQSAIDKSYLTVEQMVYVDGWYDYLLYAAGKQGNLA